MKSRILAPIRTKQDWLQSLISAVNRADNYRIIDNGEEQNFGCHVCGRPWTRYTIEINYDGKTQGRGDNLGIGSDCLKRFKDAMKSPSPLEKAK